jgi:hypothetical protein
MSRSDPDLGSIIEKAALNGHFLDTFLSYRQFRLSQLLTQMVSLKKRSSGGAAG